MDTLGKTLIGVGLAIAVIGGLMLLLGRLGVGRLPGDIVIRRDNFTFYAPLGLMILLSIIGTIVLNLLFRNR